MLSAMSEKNRKRQNRRPDDLARELERLAKSDKPQERGYLFEDLLAEYFRRQSLVVHKSPGSTRPRQTDLLIQSADGFRAACSVKWEKRRLGSSDVEEVKSLLEKMPKGTAGFLLSMSDYAKGASEYAASFRAEFEILLFSMPEIAMLISGELRLRDLIHEKRSALAAQGIMRFRTEGSGLYDDISEVDLPKSTASFRHGAPPQRVLAIPGESHGFAYGYRIQPASWGTNGRGVRLEVSLPTRTLDDMVEFVHTLPSMVGLSARSTFSIHQTHISWHGHGMRNLLQSCRSRKARYAKHPGPFHHSEHCVFFSNTRAGWIVLAFQMDTALRLHYSRMEIRLPGIPLEQRPYEELARWARYPLFFEPVVDERESAVVHFMRDNCPRLDVLSLITDDNGRIVRGLVARNPFRNGSFDLSGIDRSLADRVLRLPDNLICTVSDMHPPEMAVDYYFITRIEVLEMALRSIVEITCTWNRCLDSRAKTAGVPRDRVTFGAALSKIALRAQSKPLGLADRIRVAMSRQ
jgi:hypothetical protein